MKNSGILSPIDGLLTAVQTVDCELVADGNLLCAVSLRRNYVRGEVNEEDVGEVKPEMKGAFSSGFFDSAGCRSRHATVILDRGKPPDNLIAGITGKMHIFTCTHENAVLVPTRALLVDEALMVKHGIVQGRTVKVGFRTLDFTEALSGVAFRRLGCYGRSKSIMAGQASATKKGGRFKRTLS